MVVVKDDDDDDEVDGRMIVSEGDFMSERTKVTGE